MIQTRIAQVSDASELLRLNDLFNSAGCNSLAAIENSLRYNIQEIVCVADDGSRLAGFCCGQIFYSMCYGVCYGEITELFVLDECRRQGVASGLMLFMGKEFQKRSINHFQLFTGEDNKSAQAFYKSRGYTQTLEMMFRKRPQEE